MWFFLELTTAVVDRDTMPCTAVCTALLDLVVLLNLVFPRVRPTSTIDLSIHTAVY